MLKVKFEKVATTLKLAAVHDSERGLTVDLPDALFDSGKATLKPEAREIVSRIAGIMLGAGAVRLKVEGHTDNQGNADMNLRLSKDRANAIKAYLVDAAIPAAWIAADGFGETKPIADNETAEGRQKNRRVEIVIGRVQG
jgi:outer membrane protein OmpA-like peptidoglycan-associated protein